MADVPNYHEQNAKGCTHPQTNQVHTVIKTYYKTKLLLPHSCPIDFACSLQIINNNVIIRKQIVLLGTTYSQNGGKNRYLLK